jgi:hypothetical protein
MKIVAVIARYLIGIIFLVFGLNGFLQFLPAPPMPPSMARDFVTVMAASHYILFVAAIQVIAAVLFLIGLYVPLALVIIAPVIVNILLFHTLMAPASIGPGVLVTVLWLILAYRNRAALQGIFQRHG